MIERSFHDIPEGKLSEADQQSFLATLGWSRTVDWKDLLRSKRVLIISEAGAGKTYECRAQCQGLWNAGEPAFFLELATLATGDLADMLSLEEEARLSSWLKSQSDVATFFLDSIDELKLSLGSFEQALKRLNKGIAGQLARARIVITTRPIPIDEQLVHRLLPVPPVRANQANDESFAEIAMRGRAEKADQSKDDSAPDWRAVALMPLSDEQILDFARVQGVADPLPLLKDLRQRNAQDFARRPQDLIELCADWRAVKRIRTHREQVTTNIRTKLKPREDRRERAELSVDEAVDGASRFALALVTTRRLTIRLSAEADVGEEGSTIDPGAFLSDWSVEKRRALLERPLFGFATYGRVRFHHRSVIDFLAARRLQELQKNGMTLRALKRLIFAHTKSKTIVRPSMRSIAGWLALEYDEIFETLRDHEPAVLLTEGDPESMTSPQRSQALRAYVQRFGQGGWRGLAIPHIQAIRFATPDLAGEIDQLWKQGVENPEVRTIMLYLIEVGQISDCSEIAYATARNTGVSSDERLAAFDALAALSDPRLDDLTEDVANDAGL